MLEAADKARGRGRVRKAIKGYEKILAQDAKDWQVHARVAPLYAKRALWDKSRKSFDAAASGFLEQGFSDKAIAVWTLAAETFPEWTDYRERIANEQVRAGRRADAVNTLMTGRTQLRKARQRPLAILLLRQVIMLSPLHLEASLDLARLLAKEGERREAHKVLQNLTPHLRGRQLRRLRATQLRISPSLRNFWIWLLGK